MTHIRNDLHIVCSVVFFFFLSLRRPVSLSSSMNIFSELYSCTIMHGLTWYTLLFVFFSPKFEIKSDRMDLTLDELLFISLGRIILCAPISVWLLFLWYFDIFVTPNAVTSACHFQRYVIDTINVFDSVFWNLISNFTINVWFLLFFLLLWIAYDCHTFYRFEECPDFHLILCAHFFLIWFFLLFLEIEVEDIEKNKCPTCALH